MYAVSVETIVYVRGSQWIQSRMCGDVRQDFLGRSRSVQDDINNHMADVAGHTGGLQQICKLGISQGFC
jgi:hypothetical protein